MKIITLIIISFCLLLASCQTTEITNNTIARPLPNPSSIFNNQESLHPNKFSASSITIKTEKTKNKSSLHLEKYNLSSAPITLQYSKEDASGLTYNFDSDTIFVVENSDNVIAELTKSGDIIRTITTRGFDDVEAIAYIGNNTFLLAEEGEATVSKVIIDPKTTQISGGERLFSAEQKDMKNRGIEGLCYDSEQKIVYLAKEKKPAKVYRAKDNQCEVLFELENTQLDLEDISGIYYHTANNHLLLLSHQSQCVVETDLQGNEISRLYLKKGHANLPEDIPQAEGITMDQEGNLYICSEPDLFYIFRSSENLQE